MPNRSFDVAVLGGGPGGILAALCLARSSDVALVMKRLPRNDDPPRVDAVPARLVALLIEFGVDPRSVGIDGLHDRRWVAWSTQTPRVVRLSPAAHLERPALEHALLARAARVPRIALFASTRWARGDGWFWGDGWRALRLVDATGRAAATADSVIRPIHPWAARSFWQRCDREGDGPTFALAALPDGYAYRIGTNRCVVIGFVGRGLAVEGAAGELEERLRSLGAVWMIDDLPPMTSFREGCASTASIQWAAQSPDTATPWSVRIGDAALARDPLSSHGIAAACSEALLIPSLKSQTDVDLFELRQSEQRSSHLAAVQTMIDSCMFARQPVWREYSEFVAWNSKASIAASVVALRDGKIVQLGAYRPAGKTTNA